VDRREVPIEQLSEACRLGQRRGDQFGVVRCWLPSSGVVTRCMTVAADGVAPTRFRLRLARPTHPVRVSVAMHLAGTALSAAGGQAIAGMSSSTASSMVESLR
jgi:hypothetical protein